MTIQKNRDGNKLEIKLEGKLTAITAPDLEKELADAEKDVDEVVIDMENLDHVASAGLRTLLTLQKRMRKIRKTKQAMSPAVSLRASIMCSDVMPAEERR